MKPMIRKDENVQHIASSYRLSLSFSLSFRFPWLLIVYFLIAGNSTCCSVLLRTLIQVSNKALDPLCSILLTKHESPDIFHLFTHIAMQQMDKINQLSEKIVMKNGRLSQRDFFHSDGRLTENFSKFVGISTERKYPLKWHKFSHSVLVEFFSSLYKSLHAI